MTEKSLMWSGTLTGDAGAYSDDDWSDMFRKMFLYDRTTQGIFKNLDNALEVTGVASPVSMASGGALVDGKFYENTAALGVAVSTPAASTRIDRLVLRKNWAAQTVRATLIAGVEGGAAPAITQTDGTTWDIKLAQISIVTGGTITVTDERDFLYQLGEAISEVEAIAFAMALGG